MKVIRKLLYKILDTLFPKYYYGHDLGSGELVLIDIKHNK